MLPEIPPPNSNRIPDGTAFDMRDLTFLMRKAPKVLMSVLLEGNRYRLATYLVEEHRRLAVEDVWPKLEAAGKHQVGVELGVEPTTYTGQ